jgi:hypothetical protein
MRVSPHVGRAPVKRTNIYLDEEQDRLLRHLSVEEGRSFADVVREALNEYLARRGISSASRVVGPCRQIPEGEWQARFGDVLRRIRATRVPDETTDDLEGDITTARREMRQERAARRRGPGG